MRLIIVLMIFISIGLSKELIDISLQLKWKYQFQFAGFIVAKEKGFYADEGLDVDIREIENDINIVDEVNSGKIDFAVGDSALVYSYMRGVPISAILAIFQQSPFILLGLKSTGIKDIQDINRKDISLQTGMEDIAIKLMLRN